MRIRTGAVVLVMGFVWLSVLQEGARAQWYCDSPSDCDDGNRCTNDQCEPSGGPVQYTRHCTHSPSSGGPCEPDNHCLEGGLCDSGVCVGGVPIDCNDFNSCTVDGCDPATGCTHVGADCSDGDPCTIDQCADLGGCDHLAVDCTDGDTCTDDACDSGAGGCAHHNNGSCNANPKTLGYWQQVCRETNPSGEFFTDRDVSCIRVLAQSCFGWMQVVPDICQVFDYSGWDPLNPCRRGAQELLALTINICRGRLTLSQGIDPRCSDNTTVGAAFQDDKNALCEDRLRDAICETALCEAREINQGRALHVQGLVLSKLASGAVRLVWTPPVADTAALSGTPRSYRIWRAPGIGAIFVQIAEVADPSFEDTSAVGEYLLYDVTPVW
jgi:hypothetical protein